MVKRVKTIGIVGGGQLGRMLTLAAKPQGFEVIVLDTTENSPAAQVGAKQIMGSLYDKKSLKKLSALVDVITIETEHLDVRTLEEIANLGMLVHPSPKSLKIINDKLAQKNYFSKLGVVVPEFTDIKDRPSALKALSNFKKMVIKTRFGGYDGRGNAVVANQDELKAALRKFKNQAIYAEKYIPFSKELAVIISRSNTGKVAIYPVVETKHIRNICIEVKAPAMISKLAEKRALALAKKVANNLEGSGISAIEMFLDYNDKVLLNEVAPRVHNSGHYTIEGAETSQFEQHIRGITGMPLGPTGLRYPAVVMINILGRRNGPTRIEGLATALAIPGVRVHLYGKAITKVDRKMGHITAVGDTIEQARRLALKARRSIRV